MKEARKPLIIERQLRFVFIFTMVLLIGMGIYSLFTRSSIGGTLYGKYGGSTTVTYGAAGFFEMAAVLFLGYLCIQLGVLYKKRKETDKEVNK
ncbi:hypothetical protein SAMN05428975_2709 [Mucilaginibacter sp. OK268]|jgi:hypothetical protein|uniref:hypothetical protein n=1 Tax=Mucilaginibacter sp. OK268 TaxID=1881048 RepID=UPI0008811A33|nr:hypothetical protein [Mucilaginibacter sp. OK268]SDP78001.1 hypothetical protein SAMN05428975_2709 [Mucilaginibacter sp. OK268]